MNLPKLLDNFQRPDNSQILSFKLILITSEVFLRVSARMLINFHCLRVPTSYQISQEIYSPGGAHPQFLEVPKKQEMMRRFHLLQKAKATIDAIYCNK